MTKLPESMRSHPGAELSFDVVVVGGGSAGCVVASRLSEDPAVRVALLEAGADTPPGHVADDILSSYPMPLFRGERYIWPQLCARASSRQPGATLYEQGRVLGGGSSINVQAANRGLPRDYDRWAKQGAHGWSWNEVLPYFRKLERDLDFSGPLHGDDGPLPIRRISRQNWNAFSLALADGFASAGFRELADQNGEFDDGFFAPSISNSDDRRVSTASAYLDITVRRRPNLTIMTGHTVSQIGFDGVRARRIWATGPEGETIQIGCNRLVLAAGALSTPALLMRSGVGDGAALQKLGITCIAHTPAVGKHLQDHPCITLGHYLPTRFRAPLPPRRASLVALRYSSGFHFAPSSDMYVATSARAAWHAVGSRIGLYFIWCNAPFSRGELSLVSPDPRDSPRVELNLLSDERDALRMQNAVQRFAEISRALPFHRKDSDLLPLALSPRMKAMSKLNQSNDRLSRLAGATLDMSGPFRNVLLRSAISGGWSMRQLLRDEQALSDYVHSHVFGVWHASGTCRMGASSECSVVDPYGKVHTLDNVWIADASIMPGLPSANTNIPTIMIAEKISAGLQKQKSPTSLGVPFAERA